MQFTKLFIFPLLLGSPLMALVPGEHSFLKFKPRLSRPLAAAPIEVSAQYAFYRDGEFLASVGGHYPFYTYKKNSGFRRKGVTSFGTQVGVYGLIYSSFFSKGGAAFDVDAFDSKFGLYLDFKINRWSLGMRYSHYCANVSEGVYEKPERKENLSEIAFSREYIDLQLDYTHKYVRPYAGILYVANLFLRNHLGLDHIWGFNSGLEIDFPRLKFIVPYAAVDFSTKTEIQYKVSTSVVTGIKLVGRGESSSLRIFFRYYDGYDPRANFYSQRKRTFGGGMAYFY